MRRKQYRLVAAKETSAKVLRWIGVAIVLTTMMNTPIKRRHWAGAFRTVGVAGLIGGATNLALKPHDELGWLALGCGTLMVWIGALFLFRQDTDQGE